MTDLRDSKTLATPRASATSTTTDVAQPLTRVMALPAVAYCERLFYMEEVKEIRVADERVLAGRILHETLSNDLLLTSYVVERAADCLVCLVAQQQRCELSE